MCIITDPHGLAAFGAFSSMLFDPLNRGASHLRGEIARKITGKENAVCCQTSY